MDGLDTTATNKSASGSGGLVVGTNRTARDTLIDKALAVLKPAEVRMLLYSFRLQASPLFWLAGGRVDCPLCFRFVSLLDSIGDLPMLSIKGS